MLAMVDALGATVIERPDHVLPTVHAVISAIDPDEEVRAAVRLVVERLRRGVPLHRIAMLWPTDEPYALLAHQQLAAAGIPHNGPATRTLAHTVTGAALISVLALPDRRFRRDDVMSWLASAPIIEEAGRKEAAPASGWDGVSAAAGVIDGPEQWHTRLTNYAAQQAENKRALLEDESDDDAEPRRLARIEANLDRALRLRTFVAELAGALDPDALPRGSWTEWSEWACRLLERYLGGETRHYSWPDDEQDAWRAIRDSLEQLSVLDDVAAAVPVDLVRFRQAVDAELAAPAARHGRFGTGVFTAPPRRGARHRLRRRDRPGHGRGQPARPPLGGRAPARRRARRGQR